jgi:hypothetical protein
MGLLTAMNIADRAWTKANEATGGSATRWTSSEALMWLRDAERQIVVDLPRANTLRATPVATAGTRQTLTGLGLTSGFQVTDVVCNYNAAGTERGRPITKIDRIHLDEMRPGWHSETGDEAEHWVEDTRDPKTFYLWPSVYSAGGRIEVLYPALPTDIASINATFTIGDEFAEALQFYLLFSFFSKDATFAKSPQIAATYRSLYQQALGMRGQNIAGNSALGDTKAKGA